MTPARQPQHCDHECVCPEYKASHSDWEEEDPDPCTFSCMQRATHTPAAPALMPKDGWHTDWEMQEAEAKGFNRGNEAAHEYAKTERERVLDVLEEFLNGDDHLSLFKWEVREQIRFLRSKQEQP